MLPIPISNPPNPWATTEVEYLEGAPEVKLEVFEDHTRQILAKNDSPDVGFTFSVPEGAYYIFADFSKISDLDDVTFAKWMTQELGVATVPGN